jgi:hypothetical protein
MDATAEAELDDILGRLHIARGQAWDGLWRALLMRAIESHVAAHIGYEANVHLLGVVFRGHDAVLYLYPESHPLEWLHLLAAPSRGEFLTGEFRTRHPRHLIVAAPHHVAV